MGTPVASIDKPYMAFETDHYDRQAPDRQAPLPPNADSASVWGEAL